MQKPLWLEVVKVAVFAFAVLALVLLAISQRYELVAQTVGGDTTTLGRAYRLDQWTGEVRCYLIGVGKAGFVEMNTDLWKAK